MSCTQVACAVGAPNGQWLQKSNKHTCAYHAQDPHLGGDTLEEAEARKRHAEERRQQAIRQAALDDEQGTEMRWPYISPRGRVTPTLAPGCITCICQVANWSSLYCVEVSQFMAKLKRLTPMSCLHLHVCFFLSVCVCVCVCAGYGQSMWQCR